MATEFWESEEVKALAEALIAEHHPHLASAKVGYLFRDKAQRKKLTLEKDGPSQAVRGNISKVSAGKYTPFIDLDFILEVPYDEWQVWTEAQRRYAVDSILSTLVGEEDDEDGGEMKFFFVPTPVEIFPDVVRRWGLPFDADRDAAYVIADALRTMNAATTITRVSADPSDESDVADVVDLIEANTDVGDLSADDPDDLSELGL